MFKVLTLMLLCLPVFAKTPGRIAAEVEGMILQDAYDDTMPNTKALLDSAVDFKLKQALDELTKQGHKADADQILTEWNSIYGASLFSTSRNIGNHKPISQWLSDKYQLIETVLGQQFCIYTHIAAIKTFNSGIPVVIHPSTFPMDNVSGDRQMEYKRNFAGHSINVSDEPYNGVIPEAVYISCEIACLAGTSGIGSIACGLGASLGETLMATFIAPRLSDRIYIRFNSGIDMGDY